MGQGNCGRRAAAWAMILLGLPPAFAMDRVTPDRVTPDRVTPDRVVADPETGGSWGAPGATAILDSDGAAARPCPTRFDYLVLASFADAPSLLSLSIYHFRSELGFSAVPLTGLLRVGYRVGEYKVESPVDCRTRDLSRQTG
jgi:hypothetical protein